MKIPRQVVFGDSIWDVKFKRDLRDGRQLLDGLCCPSEYTIYIRTGLSPKERWRTFTHECVHAMDYEYNEKFRLKEETVAWLEIPLSDWMHQNFLGPPR